MSIKEQVMTPDLERGLEQEQPESSTWLDRPLLTIRSLDWAWVVFGGLMLAVVLTRFWDLGSRALHHDESLHAVYSWYLYIGNGYQHDPLMHGPFLFHLTALIFWLFGDSDFTVRVGPALFGVAIAAVPWLFMREWLGRRGALVAVALTLISPTVLYYSRFIRHDIFALGWTLLVVYAAFKYLETGHQRYFLLTAAGMALFYSTKENAYIFSALLWPFLLLIVAFEWRRTHDVASSRAWHIVVSMAALLLPFTTALVVEVFFGKLLGFGWDALDYSTAGIVRSLLIFGVLWLVGAGIAAWLFDIRRFLMFAAVFYPIFLLLHTTFLTNPFGVVTGFVGALGYWLDQHGVQRGGQPWYYYLLLLWLYEYMALAIALFGGTWLIFWKRPQGKPLDEQQRIRVVGIFPIFLLWWLVASFIAYSIAGEKMPWLSIHISFPAILLAAWTIGQFLEDVDWAALRTQGGMWFALTFLAATLAAMSLLYWAVRGDWPFRGTTREALTVTMGWLAALLILAITGGIARRLWQQLGEKVAGDAVILVILVLLAASTWRYAWLAAFVHGDIPREMLIYTQTAPDVTMVTEDLKALSQRLTGGLDMVVAYDSGASWPFEWYLRDFPNKRFFGETPGPDLANADVVLIGETSLYSEREQRVRPYIPNYIRHEYKLRWWFPEEYKDLLLTVQEVPDPNDPSRTVVQAVGERNASIFHILANVWRYARHAEYRRDFVDFLLWRKLKQPLGSTNFAMYVRPDLVKEIWSYGNIVAAKDPTLIRDEYDEKTVTLSATRLIGSFGVAEGQLNTPRAVAFAPDGRIVVADSGNHRIQVFNPDGSVALVFGTMGSAPGQFNEPWGVTVDADGNIYVADTWNHRIQKFDAAGNFLAEWGTFADTQGQLTQPAAFWGPRGIAIGPDNLLYVADTGNKRIQIFTLDGTFVGMFGGAGQAPGQLNEPTDVAVAPDGTIYVADTWNQRVQVFSREYAYLREWPIYSWGSQSIVNKPFIETDGERVWISDPENYRVIEFDTAGGVQRVWGTFGTGLDAFALPLGLAYQNGRLAVVDSDNHRVLLFDVGGQ